MDLSKTSLRRVADPKDVANTALFLSSNMSSHITGQVIRVDGGMASWVQEKVKY